jgi:epoxyqueuosine reductase
VFGCDRCQDVCPWNQQASLLEQSAFAPREQIVHPDLDWFLTLSAETFHRTFRRNPMKRTRLQGLLRNTVVAIGNSGNPAFLPLLRTLHDSFEPLGQTHIAWAIAQLSAAPRKSV